ncbi:TIGR03032 family protein [Alsobacter sp. SYSU M60028]|uniref:TIGR03032 family protein n=1 Tax=Alsobacter ponti TaxID=2962936 RepID=A0ABT1LDD6_9HYPH|nr:TIGR03032 family protein [Alsobacter ponti]MCP8939444.1 TIGR03032 family protein [Alsobacter ponti]
MSETMPEGRIEHAQAGQPPLRPAPKIAFSCSRHFNGWLTDEGISLALTSYKTGLLLFVGAGKSGRPRLFRRAFPRTLGMYVDRETLCLGTLYQILRFRNTLQANQKHGEADRFYVPRTAWITGDIDVHDMALDKEGRLVFVSSLFCCLATTSDTHSFTPLWRPPFISRLAAEDRCHLNGLAMKDGAPAWVTAISETDVADGWRDHRRTGGVVIDVQHGEIVARGLSMPHSPRWHQGRLWLHNSGTGDFGYIDAARGTFEPVAFLPGYLRGLAFHGRYAVVGTSNARGEKRFEGLALDDRITEKQTSPLCGIFVIDTETGDVVHWFVFSSGILELYDVGVIEQCHWPMALGFQTDEICRTYDLAERMPPSALRPNGGAPMPSGDMAVH